MLFSLNRIYYTRTTNMEKHSLAERDKLCVMILPKLNLSFLWSKSHNTTRQNCMDTIWFLPNMTFYEGLIQNSSCFTANLICLQTSLKQFQTRNVRFLRWATCLLGPGAAARWGLFKIFLQRKIIHLPTIVCGCVSDVRLKSLMIILARGEVALSFA